jgi:RNA polymerase primary sigma factor
MIMETLTHGLSPLAQARRGSRVRMSSGARPLPLRDQAVLKQLLEAGRYDFVPNDQFGRKDADRVIFDEAIDVPKPDTSWYHPVMDNLTDARQVRNVSSILLTAKQERALFLQFNLCRYRASKLLDDLVKMDVLDAAKSRELLTWHRKAEAYRDQIAQTNLALVLAMAKRTRMSEVDFADLVSEGNMALLRAVDKFDVARGFKFSTYACRAILKAFSRTGVKLSKHRQMFPTDFDPKLEKSDFMTKKREGHEDDCVDEVRRIIKDNTAELTDIEQEVISHRFGLSATQPQNPEARPLTLEEVGKIIGVTKERVRQIQNKALEKVKSALESQFLF